MATNSIDFQLFAPYNSAAALIGSFGDWQPMPMTKDNRGYFRTSVDLEDGTYEYKFRVQSKSWFLEPDEWVEIADPYATDVNDANQTSVLQVKEGQRLVDTYTWQHDSAPLPSNHELVIYELFVGGFGDRNQAEDSQKYQFVLEKLDYLAELGINAIELLPVIGSPGEQGWGYRGRYFFATESSYGSTEDLKQLIDECHARGIRVILDANYNYSDEKSPLLFIDRDYWYYHDRHYPEDRENYWGPEFNFDHYDENLDIKPAWSFIGDVVRFWIQEYHIDGIRYDGLRQLGNLDFMHWIAQEAKQLAGSKPFYNIGEHIPENPDLVGPEGPMDGCWHDSFRLFVRDHLTGETFDLAKLKEVLEPTQQGYSGVTDIVNALTNHDHSYPLAELGQRGILDDAAFQRVKLGVALQMTAVGVPLIWMGEEFGEDLPKDEDQTHQLNWSLLENQRNQDLLRYYKGLIALRQQNDALKTPNIQLFHENPDQKVLAYDRWHDQGARIVVVANFSDQFLPGYRIPNFPIDGTWHEWTKDYEVEAQEGQLMIDLAEYEAQVFVWE